MFPSGRSASAHLSPELMSPLSMTAFRSFRRCVILRHGRLFFSIAPCRAQDCFFFPDQVMACVGLHSRWLTFPSSWCLDIQPTGGCLWAGCFTIKRCLAVHLQRSVITLCCMKNKMKETKRRRNENRGRLSNRKLLLLWWQFTGKDGVPLMVGSVRLFLMSNWRCEDHLFMTLHFQSLLPG